VALEQQRGREKRQAFHVCAHDERARPAKWPQAERSSTGLFSETETGASGQRLRRVKVRAESVTVRCPGEERKEKQAERKRKRQALQAGGIVGEGAWSIEGQKAKRKKTARKKITGTTECDRDPEGGDSWRSAIPSRQISLNCRAIQKRRDPFPKKKGQEGSTPARSEERRKRTIRGR